MAYSSSDDSAPSAGASREDSKRSSLAISALLLKSVQTPSLRNWPYSLKKPLYCSASFFASSLKNLITRFVSTVEIFRISAES